MRRPYFLTRCRSIILKCSFSLPIKNDKVFVTFCLTIFTSFPRSYPMLTAHIVAYTVLIVIIVYLLRRNYKNKLINTLLTHRVKELSTQNQLSSEYSSSSASPVTSRPQSSPISRAQSPSLTRIPSRCLSPPMFEPTLIPSKLSADDLIHLRQTEWHH